jgi:hypothetical protein
MNCLDYKAYHSKFNALPLTKEVWDTPEREAWMAHFHSCRECSDWSSYQEIKQRGFDPDKYLCVHIANQLTWLCEKAQQEVAISRSP